MKDQYVDFIGIYPDAVDEESCKKLIEYFENHPELQSDGEVGSGLNKKSKDSCDIVFRYDKIEKDLEQKQVLHPALSTLEEKILLYKERYHKSLSTMYYWGIENTFRIQRYLPGQGYYAWHAESTHPKVMDRKLVWMLYLNTVENAGTMFYNQELITDCDAGSMIIWPADWTHIHKGETDQQEAKYILTGWFKFLDYEDPQES